MKKTLMDESFPMNQQSCFAQSGLYSLQPYKSLLWQLGIYIFTGVLMPFQRMY